MPSPVRAATSARLGGSELALGDGRLHSDEEADPTAEGTGQRIFGHLYRRRGGLYSYPCEAVTFEAVKTAFFSDFNIRWHRSEPPLIQQDLGISSCSCEELAT